MYAMHCDVEHKSTSASISRLSISIVHYIHIQHAEGSPRSDARARDVQTLRIASRRVASTTDSAPRAHTHTHTHTRMSPTASRALRATRHLESSSSASMPMIRIARAAFATEPTTTRAHGQSEVLSYARPMPRASASYEEAQKRGREFFREICRELPRVMEQYQLKEVARLRDVRSAVKRLVRENGAALEERTPVEFRAAALDQALMRGREELVAIEAHHFQRHHLITLFVNQSAVSARGTASERAKQEARSAFVRDFLNDKKVLN